MRHIFVGIITYNSAEDIITCLDSLSVQDYPNLTVYVLDNASQDQSVSLVKTHFPTITLIENTTNVGFAQGHNQIIETCLPSENDGYMALNPDVILKPNYISLLVKVIKINGAQWGSGKLLLPGGEMIYSVGHALLKSGYAFNIGYGLPDSPDFSSRAVFGVPGAAALYSFNLFKDGQLFDPAMFLYFEDIDLDWRAQRAGFRCWYCAEATAEHRGSTPSAQLRTQALANRYRSVLKNACWQHLLFYNLPIITMHILARLILTPQRGLYLLQHIISQSWIILGERTTSNRDICQHMTQWFMWSKEQPSNMPRSFSQRLIAFFKHRG